MSRVSAIERLSSFLFHAVLVVMIVVAVSVLGALVVQPPNAGLLQVAHPQTPVSPDMTVSQIAAVTAFGLVPAVIWLWTLYKMRLLFACYRKGAVLTELSARHICGIGSGFLALGVVHFVLVPVQSLLLTWSNPPNGRSLHIALNTDILGYLIAGCLLMVIGWAMQDAAAADAENRAFV